MLSAATVRTRLAQGAIALLCATALVWGWITLVERGGSDAGPAGWMSRTSARLDATVVTDGPPRVIQPPVMVDSYQVTQAATVLARSDALTDADWTAVEKQVVANLERELDEGYAGSFALAAQVVQTADAAGRPLADTEVRRLISGVAREPVDDDAYDAAAATVVRRWAADHGGPQFEPAVSRGVQRTITDQGCRGVEALLLMAALERAGVAPSPCDAAALEGLVSDELRAQRNRKPTTILEADWPLRLRAASTLARTDTQVDEVARLKAGYAQQIDAGAVDDPLTSAFALSGVAGPNELGPDLVSFLRSVIADGGAPHIETLSPPMAATLYRAWQLTGSKAPAALLIEAADLPPEAQARVLLARGSSDAEVRTLVEGWKPPRSRDVQLTAVFQLLLRHGAPGCRTWLRTARRTGADDRMTITDRALALRYLDACGEPDSKGTATLRTEWEQLRATDVGSTYRKRAVTCAMGFGDLPTAEQNWKVLEGSADPQGGIVDASGQFDVIETHLMAALMADQRQVCRDGVYW